MTKVKPDTIERLKRDPAFWKMAVEIASRHNPKVAEYIEAHMGENKMGLWTFKPRPDCPDELDEQTSFVNSKDEVSFFVGGNGAGTSVASAFKAARFMLHEQPPPRRNTPFWVASNTSDNTTNVCWGEKLQGMGFIPSGEIHDIEYKSAKANQPRRVFLKPWPTSRGGKLSKNWMIEFKSYEQGADAFQGASIGGFWFSEAFPLTIFNETIRGCRDYKFPGSKFCEFTPLNPYLSVQIKDMLDRKPPNWRVYRANTRKNLVNLEGGEAWLESMLAGTPEAQRQTRITGDFASYEGLIYSFFQESLHVISEKEAEAEIRSGKHHMVHCLGTDWGWTAEHAHCTVWLAYDLRDNSWLVYDEYWSIDQDKLYIHHVDETFRRCEYWGWPIATGEGKRCLDLTKLPNFHVNHADSQAPGWIRQYNAAGIPTVGYKKGPGSVLEGIFQIQYLLQGTSELREGKPLLRFSKKCSHSIREMLLYQWRQGPQNLMMRNPALAKPIPLDRDDHAPSAIRYGIMGETAMEGWRAPARAFEERIASQRRGIQFEQAQDIGRGIQLERRKE